MKPRNEDLFLYDIRESCDRIIKYLDGINEDSFMTNMMLQDAVVRNIEIIGEAAKNIGDELRDLYPNIPWRDVMRMRDKIAHHYFRLDLEVVWKTASEDIPRLFKDLSNPRTRP